MRIPEITKILSCTLALLCAGCGNKHAPHKQDEKLVIDDGCRVLRQQAEVPGTAEKAQRGDVDAEQRLWDYHAFCGHHQQAAYWEERLVQAGDAKALSTRSSELLEVARNLSDGNPQKFALLKNSLDLDARARKARDGHALEVMVNGKVVTLPQSGEPDEQTNAIQAELLRVSAAQHP